MPAFPYERAALVLAEARYFGKKLACQKYQVPRTTYTNWRKKLNSDDKLSEMVAIEAKALSEQWQGDTIICLKQTLFSIQTVLSNHPFPHPPQTTEEIELWAKSVEALSKIIKSLGDLTLGSHVLFEDE